MMSRRSFFQTATAFPASIALTSCSDTPDYEAVAAKTWAKPSDTSSVFDKLIHYAALAANSHNAQAWKFSGSEKRIEILPDLTRVLPAADPDNHHLYASLGCAAENAMLAATELGLSSVLTVDTAMNSKIIIDMSGNGSVDPLFAAITKRQCTRTEYDGRTVAVDALNSLASSAKIPGIETILVTDKAKIEQILELVVAANTTQVNNSDFAAELKSWIRFSETDAIATRDGLYAACSGNPTMPGWLGRMMFGLFFSAGSENDKYASQIRSSAGLAIFVSEKDDKFHWVSSGRAFQRFALQATLLDIRLAFINQPVEVVSARKELAALLGIGDKRPDMIIRFGYGPLMPRSLRRVVQDVIAV